jgi:effector-binding domain-containing protein
MAEVDEIEVPPRTIAALDASRGSGPLAVAIRAAFDRLYKNIQPRQGQRFGKNVLFYENGDSFVAGVTDAVIKTEDTGIGVRTLAGGRAAHAIHIGDYTQMDEAYRAIKAWMTERGRQGSGRSLEVYDHMDPSGATPPRTDIHVFLSDKAPT